MPSLIEPEWRSLVYCPGALSIPTFVYPGCASCYVATASLLDTTTDQCGPSAVSSGNATSISVSPYNDSVLIRQPKPVEVSKTDNRLTKIDNSLSLFTSCPNEKMQRVRGCHYTAHAMIVLGNAQTTSRRTCKMPIESSTTAKNSHCARSTHGVSVKCGIWIYKGISAVSF